jgi:hypothetical protein
LRDVFAAIEAQLEMLRSNLVALEQVAEAGARSEGFGLVIGQLDQVISRLRRYREGGSEA